MLMISPVTWMGNWFLFNDYLIGRNTIIIINCRNIVIASSLYVRRFG